MEKQQKDSLTRAIEARARAITNSKKRQTRIRANAEEECARIEEYIAKSQVLLDALKRGALKP